MDARVRSLGLPRGAAALACALLGAAACPGGPGPLRLVSAREVASAARPPAEIEVRDLGSPSLAGRQTLDIAQIDQDGLGVIGELLLVQGRHFGRLPRITIDGRTATLIARTEDGVIVRVPWGVRSGSRRVEVHNGHGHGATTFPLRRYALATVPSRDRVFVFEMAREGMRFAGAPLTVPGARLVRYSADGRTAYVTGRRPDGQLLIATVDMVHRGGPRLDRTYRVPGTRHVALAAAASAPLAVALSDTHLVFFDLRDPARPALYRPLPLPGDLASGEIVDADMDPEGRMLALLLAADNELRLFDVGQPGQLLPLARTRVLPTARVPLVRGLRFAADARTVWVISGDSAASSRRRRSHPLRLTVIKIEQIEQQAGARTRSFGVLSIWRSLDVPYRAAPVDLAVARGQPLASGATTQVPPQNAAVFITAHDSKLLRLKATHFDSQRGLQRAARMLRGLSPLGTVVRTDIQGVGGPMYTSDSLLGAIDITSDSQLLLVAGARVEVKHQPARVTLVYGVSSCAVFGKVEPRFIPLATVDPESLSRPFMLGTVRVQP